MKKMKRYSTIAEHKHLDSVSHVDHEPMLGYTHFNDLMI